METLVVLAIIMVILTFQVPALTKALRQAKGVAAGEAMHQNNISSMASSSDPNFRPKRAEARKAFRRVVDAGKFDAIVTQMLYVVRDDDEFRAYWHTLLNPNNTKPILFSTNGELVARTAQGESYRLPLLGAAGGSGESYPVGWEFISTDLSETAYGNMGGNVMYSDGRNKYVGYQDDYPMTPTVARLSHKFVKLTE